MNFLDKCLPDYFWDKVIPEPNSGCWFWLAGTVRAGYGFTAVERGGVRDYAHRITYRAFVGEIPDGLELDHKCVTPACCNPMHLEAVTHQINIARSRRKPKKKKICKNGHRLDVPGATFPSQNVCRICARAHYQATKKCGDRVFKNPRS
jgi:hypothetical protein